MAFTGGDVPVKQQTITDELVKTKASLRELVGRIGQVANRAGIHAAEPNPLKGETPECTLLRDVAKDIDRLVAEGHEVATRLEQIA